MRRVAVGPRCIIVRVRIGKQNNIIIKKQIYVFYDT